MIQLPETYTLIPQCKLLAEGQRLYSFRSSATELLRIDLIHEAGSIYQPSMLCASTANRLFSTATETLSSSQVAEFLDYRGIIVQSDSDYYQSTTSFYLLRRYLDDLLQLLEGFLHEPAFKKSDFDVLMRRRKQDLQAAMLKTSEVARKLFYSTLLGETHPMGRFATPEDADVLTLESVNRFFEERYGKMDVVVSGMVDDEVLKKVSALCGSCAQLKMAPDMVVPEIQKTGLVCDSVPSAAQTTLRVGRLIPLEWNHRDYADFILLTTLLGGYFGSRLMGNLREEHGYTYGIYARSRICRGVNIFFITADVSSDMAEAAENEIRQELQRLCDTPVDEQELELVKRVVAGDFIRSVDGVFERAERFCGMLSTGVDEIITDNLRKAINETTAVQLQSLAQRLFAPDSMLYCRVSP